MIRRVFKRDMAVNFWQCYIRFLAVAMVLGCCYCTTVDSSQPEIVERSKAEKPGWIERSGDQLIEQGPYRTLIKKSKEVQNLPFGIKDTQLTALKLARQNVEDEVKNKLTQLAKANNLPMSSSDVLNLIIVRAVTKFHEKYADVNDIYYEKYKINDGSNELNHFFNIYVLVTYPKDRFNFLYAAIAGELRQKDQADLRKLGELVASKYSGQISH